MDHSPPEVLTESPVTTVSLKELCGRNTSDVRFHSHGRNFALGTVTLFLVKVGVREVAGFPEKDNLGTLIVIETTHCLRERAKQVQTVFAAKTVQAPKASSPKTQGVRPRCFCLRMPF